MPLVVNMSKHGRIFHSFPVRIILKESNFESSFRMSATAVVTIQGYHGTDNNQE